MVDLIALTETVEHAALRETARSFVGTHGNSARVRQAMAEPLGYDLATWKRLTGELGLVGLAVPEPIGGSGASLAEVAVVVAELGRALLPGPYLSTALAATLVARAAEADPELAGTLDALVRGETTAALALGSSGDVTLSDDGRLTGTVRTVMDAPTAGVILVSVADRIFAVAGADARVEPVPAIDPTRRQGDITFESAPVRELPGAGTTEHAEDVVRTMLAVEAVAAAEHALERTVDYLKTRVQFGRPIGAFQALKHRCADLTVGVSSAKSTSAAAVQAAVGDGDELAVLGPLANLYATHVFVQVAAEMIQLHGGLGFTWEHDAHLYFKRAKSSELQWGTPSELRALIGARAGLLRD